MPIVSQALPRLACTLLLVGLSFFARAEMQLSSELASPPRDAGGVSLNSTTPLLPLTLREDEPRIAAIDLTRPQTDLLQRLRNGFAMPDLHSTLVADRQAWYLNNPTYIKRVLERSKRYLFYIVSELEDRGMPTELALLPIVESSYNPLAASPAKALGMWQFIPSTGKNYRLEQNWWLDQRRDIIASTKAALDYLQYIYEMHGDWQLALASYNWGEGAVARAIAKNQAKGLPTDYQSLTMPEETRYYVPKLQAIKNIIAQPELYGIKLDPIPNRPYFGTVDNPGDMDVALAAKLAETPLDEFIALNPAYQRPVMPGSSKSPIVVPADKVQIFLSNLDAHEQQDKPLSAWKTYTLKKGDKLETIASRYDISTAYLKQLNGINARTKVGPGFTLLVPGKDAPSNTQFAALDAKLPDMPNTATKTTAICSKNKKGQKVCKVETKPQPAAKGKTNNTKAASSKAPVKPVAKPVAKPGAKPAPSKAAPPKKK